jgi:hypothetical protein
MMKRILCTIVSACSLLLGVNANAQGITKSNSGRIENNEKLSEASSSPLELMKGKREDISKRDAFSKHFDNGDGSYTAVIGAGPIHYKKNGEYLDIDHTITAQPSATYPFANLTNMMESHFGATAHTGVKSITAEGEVREFINNKMYWEVNGQAMNVVSGTNVPVNIQGDKAYYQLFGNISAEFIVKSGERKLNYVIPSKQSLGQVPNNAQYLVFSEEIHLPSHFGITDGFMHYNKLKKTYEKTSGIFVTDEMGDVIYNYSAPSILENYNPEFMGLPSRMSPEISFERFGNIVVLYTKVKASWLLEDERTFPMAIDPSAAVYPFTTNLSSGQTYNTSGGTGNIAAGYSAGWYRGWATFSLSSLPSLSEVTDAVMSLRINTKGTGAMGSNGTTNINIGHTAFDLSRLLWINNYSVLYNAITSTQNAGGAYNYMPNVPAGNWTHVSLKPGTNTMALDEIQKKSGNTMAFFPVSFSPSWISGTTQRYYVIAGYSDANRPYLTVTYTAADIYNHPAYQYANAADIGDVGYIQIGNVNIGSVNNNTAITNYAAGAMSIYKNTPTGYQYYNELSTEISPGSSYPLNVTYRDLGIPYNSGKIAVWVDWNEDGDFADVNEYIGLSANTTSGNQLLSFTINVPSAVSSGSKRLRIRSFFNDDTVTASSYDTLFEYGETEEYNLTVVQPMVCSALTGLTSTIGTPANGLNHHLNLSWDAVAGATGYDVQYSTDGSTYDDANPSSVNTNSAQTNAGDVPNAPYWFRVRAKDAIQTCDWTYVGPIYTAADVPAVPLITNAGGASLELTLPDETPVVNPANTQYSIYCTSASLYVQANGTLGATEVYQTKAQWSTILVTGLTTNSNYCFYAKARNADGNIVMNNTATACVYVAAAVAPRFHDYGGNAQLAFNNSRFNSTTPVFRLSHTAGTASEYQIEVNTTSAFSGTSWTQIFAGSYAALAQNNFTFTNTSGQLVNGTTYYVRARINTGFGFGAWTTGTYSFTYDTAKEEADWFQTTQPQFQTGTLNGAEANASNNVVVSSGGGGNILNPSFETNTSWTTYATGGSELVVSLNNAGNWSTQGSRAARMYMFGGYALSSDLAAVSQVVDLTGVEQIVFDARSLYSQNFTSSLPNGGTLRLIIGGTSSDAAGVVVATINHCASGSTTCNVQSLNNIANIPVAQRTTNQRIKFVWTGFTQGDLGGAVVDFMVDNVRAVTVSSGTITSPTIYKASKNNSSTWETLSWSQTLNGGAVALKLQEVVAGNWTDISGYNNISMTGNGLQTFDVTGLSADSLRIVANLSGTTSPVLHDWSISAGGCVAPVVIGELDASVIGCSSTTTTLSLSGEGSGTLAYQWQVSSNGGIGWGNVLNSGRYSGAQTNQLIITNNSMTISGNHYRLRVTNECGTAYSNATVLTIQVCPTNDNPLSNNPTLSLPTNVYPNCVAVEGSTTGATVNGSTGTRDVWYRFDAISNAVSVQVSSSVIDPIIYLFDINDLSTPLDEENIVVGTGTEILNFNGLVAGNSYRIAIASASTVDGTFSICMRQLRIPQCQSSGTQSLCAMIYSAVTGAPSTTATFTDIATDATTSQTFNGNSVLLSTPALGLRYHSSYDVQFTATYPLVNGLGEPEVIEVASPGVCNITIAPHALIEVKANNRCTSTTLARTATLAGGYLSGANCNFSSFRFEFTPVDNCSGANPRYEETFTKTVTATAPNISINYAFNQLVASSYPATGYWLVRIRPRFTGYEGEYGPASVIAVRNTAGGSSSMAIQPNLEPAKGVNTMGNIEANIYPNPNNGELVNLNITGITSSEVYVRVLDSMGREVYTNRYTVDGSLNTMVSFTRPLAQGVYMVEMRAGEEVKTQRMIVTK